MKRIQFKTKNSVGHYEVPDDEEILVNKPPKETKRGDILFPPGIKPEVEEEVEELNEDDIIDPDEFSDEDEDADDEDDDDFEPALMPTT